MNGNVTLESVINSADRHVYLCAWMDRWRCIQQRLALTDKTLLLRPKVGTGMHECLWTTTLRI